MLPIEPNDKLVIVNVAPGSTVIDHSLEGECLLKPDGRIISRGQVPESITEQIQPAINRGEHCGDFNVGPIKIVWEVF